MNHVVLTALFLLSPFFAQQQPVLGSLAPSQQKAAAAAAAKRLAPLLEEAGFKNYRKAEDGVWVINFKGDHTQSIDVVVQAEPAMVVVLSTVKKSAKLTTEQMGQLFRANYDANFCKLAIDADGDLLSMAELPADTTAQALRNAVDEVASLADTAVGVIVPTLAASAESLEVVPAGSGGTLSLLRGRYELSYDPAKWKVDGTEGDITRLEHVSGEAWVRVIPDRVEVAPDHFQELVILNAKSIDPNVRFISETSQTINGLRAGVLRYEASKAGIKFTFYNQMYSETAGTIQIAAWTPTSFFEEYQRDFLQLFAGFRKVNPVK